MRLCKIGIHKPDKSFSGLCCVHCRFPTPKRKDDGASATDWLLTAIIIAAVSGLLFH